MPGQLAARAKLVKSWVSEWRIVCALARLEIQVILLFLMSTAGAFREDFDPLAPQREAALFYGLFLRGHSPEALRKDIDVPKKLLEKLLKRHRNETAVRQKLQRVYQYRKQVLAVFDELVTRERIRERIQ